MPGDVKPWEQPLTTPVVGEPKQGPGMLTELLRLLPGMSKFGMTPNVHLPMEVGQERDPRLGMGSQFDAIRGGLEQVRDLGRPVDPAQSALESIKRSAGVLKR